MYNTVITTTYDFSSATVAHKLATFARTAQREKVSPEIMHMITAVIIDDRRFTMQDLSNLFISAMEGDPSSVSQRNYWVSLLTIGYHFPQLAKVSEQAFAKLEQGLAPNTA